MGVSVMIAQLCANAAFAVYLYSNISSASDDNFSHYTCEASLRSMSPDFVKNSKESGGHCSIMTPTVFDWSQLWLPAVGSTILAASAFAALLWLVSIEGRNSPLVDAKSFNRVPV